jgi:hypothetical protein
MSYKASMAWVLAPWRDAVRAWVCVWVCVCVCECVCTSLWRHLALYIFPLLKLAWLSPVIWPHGKVQWEPACLWKQRTLMHPLFGCLLGAWALATQSGYLRACVSAGYTKWLFESAGYTKWLFESAGYTRWLFESLEVIWERCYTRWLFESLVVIWERWLHKVVIWEPVWAAQCAARRLIAVWVPYGCALLICTQRSIAQEGSRDKPGNVTDAIKNSEMSTLLKSPR